MDKSFDGVRKRRRIRLPYAAAIDGLFSTYRATTPGVAVGVVADGKFEFERGYGMANLEHGVPTTSDTVFHMASVLK